MIKLIDDTTYNEICEWFKFWKWQPLPRQFMPETTFILEKEGINICSCCLYLAKTGGLCITEWTVINPKTPKHLRKDCIKILLTYTLDYAKSEGYNIVFCSTANSNLIAKLEEVGYTKTDLNVTNFIKVL